MKGQITQNLTSLGLMGRQCCAGLGGQATEGELRGSGMMHYQQGMGLSKTPAGAVGDQCRHDAECKVRDPVDKAIRSVSTRGIQSDLKPYVYMLPPCDPT